MTMTLISTATVGAGGAASIDFTSIPQDGTDLVVMLSGRSTDTSPSPTFYFNSDNTLTNYSVVLITGTGTTADSEFNTHSNLGLVQAKSDSTANTFGSSQVIIPNYTSTVIKVWSVDGINENNSGLQFGTMQRIQAGKWTSTAAIISLTLKTITGSFTQNTTASLYKITKGTDGITVVT